MTVLTVCDRVSHKLRSGIGLTSVYTSDDAFAMEMAELANDCAEYIAAQYDWRKLHTLKTQAGDGTTTAFDLPTDYDRMPIKAAVFRTSTTRPMCPINDLDAWLLNRLQSISSPEGEWIILGGQINTFPAMAATDNAKFYYITNLIVHPSAGSNKALFTADTDSFVLRENLLRLCMIWKWRHNKGYDYAEDMQNFEIALAQEIARDKGSHIIKVGPARVPDGVSLAYPGVITP